MKKAFQMKKDHDQADFTIEHTTSETTRLNKYISSSGFCSRRAADRYIESGKVKIDGITAQLGDTVFVNQEVSVEGQIIVPKKDFVYIALNKPKGIVCTTDVHMQDNIIDFMDYKETIFPIGRLDKDSSGLILLTNDGDIVNKILRSKYHHEKEYIVKVDKQITNCFIKDISEGVQIYNPVNNSYQVTKACTVKKVNDTTFHIILTEGLNRQIRRMCTALGYHVQNLQRVRIMDIHLGSLRVGQWRYLSLEELRVLNANIQENNT